MNCLLKEWGKKETFTFTFCSNHKFDRPSSSIVRLTWKAQAVF